MSRPAPESERIWEYGWEGHTIAQLRRMARLSFPDKLKWLERAHRLAKEGKIVKRGRP